MGLLLIDDQDERFAGEELGDGTWKLYERREGERRWTEIDRVRGYDELADLMWHIKEEAPIPYLPT